MKLLTARDDCGTHVYVGAPGGLVRLDDLADALTGPALKGHADVGALLRIGESVRDILEGLADRVADSVAAMKVVAGFTILNDISARDLQHRVSQWLYGKSLDTFAPTGPFVATPDEVEPYASLRVQTRVNGELRQDASCGDMIFNPSRLVSYISEGITLEPGDIIATRTPSGVGLGFKPPRYLNVGDTVEVSITGLGTLRSPIGEA